MASNESLPFSSLSPRRKRQRSSSQSPSSIRDNAEVNRRQRRRHHDLSVEVCKEFIRSACRRAEIICKFAHPPSTVTIERGKVIACADSLYHKCFRRRACRYFHPPPHIQESLLNVIRMEDAKYPVRSLSPSPSDGSDDAETSRRQRRRHDLSVEVCKDFIRGACWRAEIDCKFAHPPSAVTIERGKVIACTDLLRSKCFRGRSCPYFHPPSQIEKSLLKTFGMEDTKDAIRPRSPSQSPSYDNEDAEASRRHDLSVEVCKDFIRSSCQRADIDCKFAHPPSAIAIERGKVIACFDSLRGKCLRGQDCSYFHPPPQIQESLLKAIGMEGTKDPMVLQNLESPAKLPNDPQSGNGTTLNTEHDQETIPVCRDFLKNACNRRSCKFAHPDSQAMVLQYLESSAKLPNDPQSGNNQETIAVCRDFLKNACNRRSCKFAHPDSQAMGYSQHHGLSLKLQSSTLLENGGIPNATLLYQDVVPVCKDFLKNVCNRDYCKYFHLIPQSEVYLQQHGTLVKLPSSPPPPETERKRLSVCRDYLKKACQRDSCKYAHPNSETKVVDNKVEICRDFCRGLCNRAICRFYHPRTCSAEK